MTGDKNRTGYSSLKNRGDKAGRVRLTLISSQVCPYRREAKNLLKRLVNALGEVVTSEVPANGKEGVELCRRFNISVIPAIVVEGLEKPIVIEGMPEEEELARVLKLVKGEEG